MGGFRRGIKFDHYVNQSYHIFGSRLGKRIKAEHLFFTSTHQYLNERNHLKDPTGYEHFYDVGMDDIPQ